MTTLSRALGATVALALGFAVQLTPAPADAQSPLPVNVAINRLAPGPPVPQAFLGLSFEAAALDQISQYAGRGDLVNLLRSLGPGIIRFGGITSDQNIGWTDAATPKPPWASRAIDAAQLQAIGRLARRSGWKVLLTVGMAHFEPTAAAREVAAAHRALGPYLAAVEIGNEPDAYGKHGFRELPWIAQGYEEQVSEYREAIAALTPGVPIAGPDVSGSGIFIEWGEEEALSQRPALLTGHHYPLGCAQKPPPTIETLLSVLTRGRESASLGTYMKVSRNQHVPLRIDEAGSVSCGGVAGISNTFASALWATGYITQVMASGAVGINLQGNPGNCAGYTPMCAPDPAALATGTLHAQPDWYAMLLTRSLVGYRPLPTTVQAEGAPAPSEGIPAPVENGPAGAEATPPPQPASAPNLVVASFSGPNHGVQIVLVDDEPPGARPLALHLNVGGGLGPGQVLRLTGPKPSATGDILLGGHAVAAGGSLRAPIRPERLTARAGGVAVTLAPSSAALVTVGPRTATHKPHRARH
ncbi:MAG TPA: hypothetical protein VGI24_11350 [Solirubrobacteraceae bacterium]|jgi:hypothetical protein